jgi:nucleotide-binding universal stress UspA family protein
MAATLAAVKRIVVGVDGSDSAKHAVEWTARLAKAMRSEVIAVCALDLPVALPDPYTMPLFLDDKVRAGLEKDLVTKWCRPLKTAGVKFRAVLRDGRPASVILDLADQEKAGLIVVGRRGRGEVGELLLGSVSHEIVLHSKRPVLLVPRNA